jgi:hypothetical protein
VERKNRVDFFPLKKNEQRMIFPDIHFVFFKQKKKSLHKISFPPKQKKKEKTDITSSNLVNTDLSFYEMIFV